MPCSPARLLANRANSARSTGPKTPEGKARSRGNALKHGMTGGGVALVAEDAGEVERLAAELDAELRPSGPMGRILVRRIAALSVRLDRCVDQEAAALAAKARHAAVDHDERRHLEVAALFESLADDPAAASRRLRRTPEGVDATIAAWLALKSDLTIAHSKRWTAAHSERAHHLAGRRSDDVPVSRVNELSHAIWGDGRLLGDREGAPAEPLARASWARERLAEWIDAEVESLRAHRATLDADAFALDRAEAARRSQFDPSPEAVLARRYEAAAERGLFRSLDELRRVEAETEAEIRAEPDDEVEVESEPLASFGAGPEGTEEAEPVEPETDPEVVSETESTRIIAESTATDRPDAPSIRPFDPGPT